MSEETHAINPTKRKIYVTIGASNHTEDDRQELNRVKDNLNFIRTEMRHLVEIEQKYKAIERGIESHIKIHNSIYGKTTNLY